jgi:hypothetical protein
MYKYQNLLNKKVKCLNLKFKNAQGNEILLKKKKQHIN